MSKTLSLTPGARAPKKYPLSRASKTGASCMGTPSPTFRLVVGLNISLRTLSTLRRIGPPNASSYLVIMCTCIYFTVYIHFGKIIRIIILIFLDNQCINEANLFRPNL